MAADVQFKFTTTVQEKILAVLWTDVQSYNIYRECIKPKYFQKSIHIDICRLLFDYWTKYGKPPTEAVLVEEVETMIEKSKAKQKMESEYLDCISRIANMELHDYEYVKDKIIEFGKKQAMIEAIMECAEIIEGGKVEEYDRINTIVQNAQMVGEDVNDIGMDFWDNYEGRLDSYNDEEDVIERFPTGMDALDVALKGGLGRTEMGVILAPPGRGKALHPDTKVLTPHGYEKIKDLSEGDKVISVDGTSTTVTGVFYHKKKSMYKVHFLDGKDVICCDEHLWDVQTRDDRVAHKTKYRTLQLKDMLHNIKVENKTRCNYSIPTLLNPVEFEPKGELSIDPWLMGALIGDGSYSSGNFDFVNPEKDVCEKFNNLLPKENYLKLGKDGLNHSINIHPEYKSKTFPPQRVGLKKLLRNCGLLNKRSWEKFIPEEYLYASVEDRLKLLQGLLDTDGYCRGSFFEFSSASQKLVEQVRFLAQSLGCSTGEVLSSMGKYTDKNGKRIETRMNYSVSIHPYNNLMVVTSEKQLSKYTPDKKPFVRFIESVEKVEDSDAICIMVDHPSHLYVIDNMIVTHNTTAMQKCGITALRNGKNVVHISLENNEKQIMRNYDIAMLGHPLDYIRENIEKCSRALGYAKKYGAGNLFIKKYATKKASVDTIRMYLNKLIVVKGVRPDVLIIDYGALLKPLQTWNDKRNTLEGNYEDMRALADEYNVALWTGAQGNRSSLSKKIVTMEDLAEAFAIANTADVMVALCQTIRERADEVIRAFLTKNRDGVGEVLLKGKINYDTKNITLTEDITRSMVEEDDDSDDDDADERPRRGRKPKEKSAYDKE